MIKAYENGQVTYSVIPVENSIEGSVHVRPLTIFSSGKIHAVAEIVQPIAQQLLATDAHKSIEVIYSHPSSYCSGEKYIQEHFPQARIEVTANYCLRGSICR